MIKKGIWVDKNKALIIKVDADESYLLVTIQSNIDHYNIKGGSGTKFKGGPQDVVQDSKFLERENHQFKMFFREIVYKVTNAQEIVILGPSGAKGKFKKELEINYPNINSKVVSVEVADSMTDNQAVAWVKNFFIK